MSLTSEELLAQERQLQFARFGNDVAIDLGLHLLGAAPAHRWTTTCSWR